MLWLECHNCGKRDSYRDETQLAKKWYIKYTPNNKDHNKYKILNSKQMPNHTNATWNTRRTNWNSRIQRNKWLSKVILQYPSSLSMHLLKRNVKIKIKYPLSCQYRNADENVMNRILVSHPQYRMRREREPTRVSYKIVTRISYGKKKSMKLYMQKYVPKSSKLKAMLCDTMSSLTFRREI